MPNQTDNSFGPHRASVFLLCSEAEISSDLSLHRTRHDRSWLLTRSGCPVKIGWIMELNFPLFISPSFFALVGSILLIFKTVLVCSRKEVTKTILLPAHTRPLSLRAWSLCSLPAAASGSASRSLSYITATLPWTVFLPLVCLLSKAFFTQAVRMIFLKCVWVCHFFCLQSINDP